MEWDNAHSGWAIYLLFAYQSCGDHFTSEFNAITLLKMFSLKTNQTLLDEMLRLETKQVKKKKKKKSLRFHVVLFC